MKKSFPYKLSIDGLGVSVYQTGFDPATTEKLPHLHTFPNEPGPNNHLLSLEFPLEQLEQLYGLERDVLTSG